MKDDIILHFIRPRLLVFPCRVTLHAIIVAQILG